jgi:GAF domain-containing protein
MSDPTGARDGTLATALEELAGLLLSTDSFQQLMQQIAELAVQTIRGTITCGITVGHGGRVVTIASSGPLGSMLDERQYDLDEGPCLEALRTGHSVSSAELAQETRWDGYPQTAMAHGVSAIHARPMIAQGATLGVLNLYADQPRAFDSDAQQHLIGQVAAVGAVAIASALRNSGDVGLTQQLRTALNSRSVIDQAIGIVVATQRCSPDEAFALLRGISQTSNVRLARIAQELVDRSSVPQSGSVTTR